MGKRKVEMTAAVEADVRALPIPEVARRYNVSEACVRKWRKKLGLGSPTLAARLERNLSILGRVPDADVAFIVGASAEQVARYRKKRRIPMQGSRPLSTPAAQADIATLPPSEVAARWRVTPGAVTYRRRAAGLPLLRRPMSIGEVEAIIRVAGTAPDSEVGDAIGRSVAAVGGVRRMEGLASWRERRAAERAARVDALREQITNKAG